VSADLFGTEPEIHSERSMIERLNRRYGKTYTNGSYVGRRYSRAEKVGTSAGFAERGARIADYLATDAYTPPFNGRTEREAAEYAYMGLGSIIGHEIKVSRSDWLAELRDPSKAEAWARHCHYWYIVAPADVVRDDLPEGWGLLVPWRDSLRVRVKAVRRDSEPMPPSMTISLCRAVVRTEAGLKVTA